MVNILCILGALAAVGSLYFSIRIFLFSLDFSKENKQLLNKVEDLRVVTFRATQNNADTASDLTDHLPTPVSHKNKEFDNARTRRESQIETVIQPKPNLQIVFKKVAEGWVATVPGLAGCQTYGSTLEEARANIDEALNQHDLFFFGEREEIIQE